jgi:hypothetical protein
MEFIAVPTPEFIEIAKRNPLAIAKFESYYKYYFYFTVAMENHIWRFAIGGESRDIYELNIGRETPLTDLLSYSIDFVDKSLP